ncbi:MULTISPECIES: ureidoglycolate lyase [Rhodomicrobium]|uniref:ureidoglycolate lyase n=1 Tax=Rhodomicrobium TaxID=1068 RepID=UPI000B4BEF0B|nr:MULTISPECIES: ureidoglycolate lyase [Rhodomicrobium]
MRTILAEPISAEAFAPFGELLVPPAAPGRDYFDASLSNARPGARPSVSLAVAEPVAVPLDAVVMERHQFSSQSFVPVDADGYLAIVAPHAADGGPDVERGRAFLVPGGQGITFRADVWHHPMACLNRPSTFAIVMWLDGSSADTELVSLATPFRVALAD